MVIQTSVGQYKKLLLLLLCWTQGNYHSITWAHYNKYLYNKSWIVYNNLYYQNMSWIDSNSTVCTDIVNKECDKLCWSEYFGPMNLMIATVVYVHYG